MEPDYTLIMDAGGGFEPPGSKTTGYEPATLPTTLYPAIELFLSYSLKNISLKLVEMV
jgi:hypothetical protein